MNRITEARIRRAIRRAEAGTTGTISVRVIPDRQVDAFARAQDEFEAVGLHNAPDRNASLILVAPAARKYAVLGDREMHLRVGDQFWQRVVDEMRPYLTRNDQAGALLYAIDQIGEQLHAHFPVNP